MSEHVKGPPLRLGDVVVDREENRVAAKLVREGGDTAALVFGSDGFLPTVQANAVLFMGAPRMHRALAALLKASRDPALGLPGDSGDAAEIADRAAAENRLDRAEREAGAALTAATYGAGEAPEEVAP